MRPAAQRQVVGRHNPLRVLPLVASTSTRTSRHVKAPRARVYRALVDARAIAKWKVPTGMTCQVHTFDAREGSSFRISLTYDEPTGTGKTTAHTDTYHGHFVKLVPNEQVVEVMEFETADAAMRGEMVITFTLTDAGVGTECARRTRRCATGRLAGGQPGGLAGGTRQAGSVRRGGPVRPGASWVR